VIGRRSNRSAIGARVTVRSGALTQVNHVTTSTGYACSSELPVHFGLGTGHVDSIEIVWPSGVRQVLRDVAPDKHVTLHEQE